MQSVWELIDLVGEMIVCRNFQYL